jgi:hypothetical protein
MSIRDAFIVSLLGIFGCASAAWANSCANVNTMGSYDESGLHESEYGIYAVGTFRIEGEKDERTQPMFNLTMVNCENQRDDMGRVSLECKVTQAVVLSDGNDSTPNPDNPNCSLDLDLSTYSMKELQKGVLTGMESSIAASTGCFNTMLTIDRNTKRVYLAFTRTRYADNYDKTRPGTCGVAPRTQVLMNCTAWPKIRSKGPTPPRYCNFSGASDK